MENSKKNLISFSIIMGFLALVSVSHSALAAASFNNDSLDRPTLRVANGSVNPNCTTCWSSSVSANPGDTISFDIYYHNTSSETASQTRVSTILPIGTFTSTTVFGSVWSQNSPSYTGNVTINLTSAQTLTFVPNSVRWYPNRGTSAQTLLNGQSGSEMTNSSGLNIGDITAGWESQGHVVLSAIVGGSSGSSGSFSVNTISANPLTSNSMTLNGSVNPGNSNTNVWFEWGTSPSFGNTTSYTNMGSGSSLMNFSQTLTGLYSNTIYYYRAVAQNSYNTVYGSTLNFNTSGYYYGGGCQPVVTTSGSTFITNNAANLRGAVNPQSRATTAWFEYGRTYSLGSKTDSQNMGMGTYDNDFVGYTSGLEQNATYYYRATAQNSCGTAYGSILSFTTSTGGSGMPSANTLQATDVTSSSAVFRGEVNPKNSQSTAWFEWGTDSSLSSYSATSPLNVNEGDYFKAVNGAPSSLSSNTNYYYRMAARNNFGTVKGGISSFRTSGVSASTPSYTGNVPIQTSTFGPDLMDVSIYADKSEIDKNEIGYRVEYKNVSNIDVYNATLKIVVHKGLDFENSQPKEDSYENNVLFYNLGKISKGASGTVNVWLELNENFKEGDELVATAILDFTNYSGNARASVSDYVSFVLDKSIFGLFSVAGMSFLNLPAWMYVILGIFAAILIVRYKAYKILFKE